LKLHIKLDQEKYYNARFPLVEVVQEEAEVAKDSKKDAKKDPKKGGKDDKPAEKVFRIEERDVDMTLEFVDQTSLNYVVEVIRTLIQTSPKMVILLVSFGFPVGSRQKDFS